MTSAVGGTNQVSLTFVTDYTPSQVSARKFNPNTQTFSDVPGATITETTVSGAHALVVSYSITDGGPLDTDGLANGSIVDPIGLAAAAPVVPATVPSTLAPTGQNLGLTTLIVDILALLSILAVITMTIAPYWQRRSKGSKISFNQLV